MEITFKTGDTLIRGEELVTLKERSDKKDEFYFFKTNGTQVLPYPVGAHTIIKRIENNLYSNYTSIDAQLGKEPFDPNNFIVLTQGLKLLFEKFKSLALEIGIYFSEDWEGDCKYYGVIGGKGGFNYHDKNIPVYSLKEFEQIVNNLNKNPNEKERKITTVRPTSSGIAIKLYPTTRQIKCGIRLTGNAQTSSFERSRIGSFKISSNAIAIRNS